MDENLTLMGPRQPARAGYSSNGAFGSPEGAGKNLHALHPAQRHLLTKRLRWFLPARWGSPRADNDRCVKVACLGRAESRLRQA